MTATPMQIMQLRRMVAEPTESVYPTVVLAQAIERYPLPDTEGNESDDDEWVATYDLNAAAAEIWMEKAGARAENMNFTSDGARFDHKDQHDNALRMARYYGARRALGTFTVQR